MNSNLQDRVQRLASMPSPPHDQAIEVVQELRAALNSGEVRAATRDSGGRWIVHEWVKRGILLAFRHGKTGRARLLPSRERPDDSARPEPRPPFFDKDTLPLKNIASDDGVRIVPGGTAIRDGAYLGRGVVIMPPAFINIGAFVDEETVIDSHALIGSCAQIGRRCHISAAAQIGGVLEPVGAMPVIIEDDVLIGGNCGVYDGAIIRERAILAAGVILTGSTPVYDIVREKIYRKADDAPLEIPAGAVVVPGTRPIKSGKGSEWGLSLATPVIVKYRDDKTDLASRLEDLLR